MKKLVLLLVCLGLCGLAPARADVLWVCGDVSGTWTADTVMVWCEVRVPPGDTLIIAPGVRVLFWDYCKFIVDTGAVLHAVGTASDTILFDEYVWRQDRQGNRWKGIRFMYASDSSRLEYCHLTHGQTPEGPDNNGGGVYCRYSSPTIRNCLFSDCHGTSSGGAISCHWANPLIINNTIAGNSSGFHGGAIVCYYGSPTISDNLITGNTASYCGGGIACVEFSSPVISGNTISGNTCYADWGGAAISCDNSSPQVSANIITGNTAHAYGGFGAIACYNGSHPDIVGNTISGNSNPDSWRGGAGIGCGSGSSPNIVANTIRGNSADWYTSRGGGISCWDNSNPLIERNIIVGNRASNLGGGISCYNSSPTIQNCLIDSCSVVGGDARLGGGIYCTDYSNATIISDTIRWNSAQHGAGIWCTNSSNATIQSCLIEGNSASGDGGGMHADGGSNPNLSGNRVSGNTAGGSGGGLWCSSIPRLLDLNEISNNTASNQGGGIWFSSFSDTLNKNTIACNHAGTGGALYCTSSSPVLINCILWGNTATTQPMIYQTGGSNTRVTYSDLQSFWPGTGNIFSNPQFIYECADHHLLCSSPCIDSGDPSLIYNDPDGTRADMGCYYFDGWTSLPVLVTWMDGGNLRVAWTPSCPTGSYYVSSASEPFPDVWLVSGPHTDTTITFDISRTDKNFYRVEAVR